MDRLGQPCRRAADIGCAVGGASFRLADRFEEVWGFDLSAKLVEAARTLKQTGELRYRRRDEGELSTDLVARIESPLARERAHFRQADACALPPELHDFDAVLAANLLCRIPSPRTFLARLGGARGLVRRGGILVIASPFSWMEKFTPREVWLGGVEENGRRRRSEDGLAEALPDFERLDRRELPLLIREHARKFEYIVPLVTVWRKR
jgi:putative 4-mercaptohistidine N1-methyltranferase